MNKTNHWNHPLKGGWNNILIWIIEIQWGPKKIGLLFEGTDGSLKGKKNRKNLSAYRSIYAIEAWVKVLSIQT